MRTNKVAGSIIVRESRQGIPNLLATLYESSSGMEPRDYSKIRNPDDIDISGWKRLASAITNDQGRFNIIYNIENDVSKSRRKVDLLLVISSPEESCLEDKERAYHIEYFIITLL